MTEQVFDVTPEIEPYEVTLDGKKVMMYADTPFFHGKLFAIHLVPRHNELTGDNFQDDHVIIKWYLAMYGNSWFSTNLDSYSSHWNAEVIDLLTKAQKYMEQYCVTDPNDPLAYRLK